MSDNKAPTPSITLTTPTVYLVVVVVVVLAILMAIIAVIVLRPDANSVSIAVSIAGIAAIAFPAIMSWLKASQAATNSAQAINDVKSVHVDLNSRLDQWQENMQEAIKTAALEAYARGRLEGQAEPRVVDKPADGEGAT